jgi:glycine cleavage system H protein
MNIPNELKYSNDHEWLRVEGDVAYVGISHFAQNELGDIIFVEIIKGIGEVVEKDDIFGTIEAVKTVSDVFLPISGKILEINGVLDKNPELLNSDCYGDGWLVKIEIINSDEIETLHDSESYKSLIGK